jgi:dimeric dUTPase (all-alpha-NTP-PPase superfamily)
MNLSKLFEMQKALDERIVKEKGLEGQDLLPQKILALQVELGELANEWRGFKYWSEDREPRTKVEIGAYDCSQGGKWVVKGYKNPLLEEYVDCLHFILSIGLDHKVIDQGWDFELGDQRATDIISGFTQLFATRWDWVDWEDEYWELDYFRGFELFVWLGEMLGFTWKQIEEAYMNKLAVNHQRQQTGY